MNPECVSCNYGERVRGLLNESKWFHICKHSAKLTIILGLSIAFMNKGRKECMNFSAK